MSANASRPYGPRNAGQKVPDRYICSVGGEWRVISSFSKRQQKIVQDKLARGIRVDAAKTGMICRIHSGEPIKEIQCEGPCNEIRVLDDFSKNNRVKGNYICKHCQHWTNAQEPGYAPWAAPRTQLDPLEKMDDFEGRLPAEPSDIFDFHNENEKPLAPVTGTDGLTAPGDNEMDGPSLRAAAVNANRSSGREIAPPRLDTESVTSSRHATESVVSNDTNLSRLAELSGSMANMWLSQATVAQDYTDRRIHYNAWDSSGRQYAMNKTPTIQSGRSSAMGTLTGSSKNIRETSKFESNMREGNARENITRDNVTRTARTHGFGSAPERQSDRKQLTEKEHRELQRTLPNRTMIMPELVDDGVDEDSE